jgi:hypothetical protein
MRRMSFTQELKALATANEEMDAGGCWREVPLPPPGAWPGRERVSERRARMPACGVWDGRRKRYGRDQPGTRLSVPR